LRARVKIRVRGGAATALDEIWKDMKDAYQVFASGCARMVRVRREGL
jgi:hypothetical protein